MAGNGGAGWAGGNGNEGAGEGLIDDRLVSNRGIEEEVVNPVLGQDCATRFGAEKRYRAVGDFEVTVRPGSAGHIRWATVTVAFVA